ncbi:hypothetical protein FPCIR_3951 [Fusarium pseudocircinatum]|uniref:Uncharacterized protein n=1 Tax=Fusarium pseudocircinatum TaxID=56676 RepID=A0A8H5PHT4_9HYPO|nr:hypothetical protein FPCIR_3951 [Fusarium pseudocircinatum]
MPLPDTDERIQARWGPRERLFHQWCLDNSKAIQDTLKFEAKWNAFDLLLQRRWPRKQDREAYYAWSREWNGRHMLRMSYRMTPREFLDKVLLTNFLDTEESVNLWWAMDTYNLPSIPLGYANFGGVGSYYVFEPAHRCIKPDRNETGPSVMGKHILAMTVRLMDSHAGSETSSSSGTQASSSSRSRASSVFSRPEKPQHKSRASTGSAQQANPVTQARNEIDPNNFVFAQLGILYVFGGDGQAARRLGPKVLSQGPWWRNDLRVVVRLDSKGKPGAVYVLYHPNSSIEVEDDSDDVELAPEAEYHVPGRLHPRCNEGFTLAKVANSLKELGEFNKEFRFLPITTFTSVIHRAQILEHRERGLTISPALAMVKRAP